jgi:hypothetical protein
VEAKVVYHGNATEAVRSALGQLLSYRHLLYADEPAPELLAVFNEEVGPLYVDFLESQSVGSIWRGQAGWEGSIRASKSGFVAPAPGGTPGL